MKRVCLQCAADISHKRSNAEYCSRSCKGSAASRRWKERNPEQAREYYTSYSRQWYAQQRAASGASAYRDEVRNCKQCGRAFSPNTHNQTHCSTGCKRKFASIRYEPKRAAKKRVTAREQYQIEHYGKPLDPIEMKRDKYRVARQLGYRSGLEVKVAEELKEAGVNAEYESERIRYSVPARTATYTPDFILPNGIVIETKGRFEVKDRQKHLIIKEQTPDLDLRFVFSSSKSRISKGSKTTYADWCIKHGFKYADKSIPNEWLEEASLASRFTALDSVKVRKPQ